MTVLKSILLLLITLLILYVAFYVHDAGFFKSIEPQFSGQCTVIKGIVGAEDIHIDQARQVAYISAHDRRNLTAPTTANIYEYSLKDNTLTPLITSVDPDFRPHGLYFYQYLQQRYLYVVNHADSGDRIDSYQLEAGQWQYRKQFTDPLLVSLNDLVVVGVDQFYVTNDHYYATGLMRTLEDYLRLKWSNVVYFDGNEYSVVAQNISYANGINVSSDGSTVYVASPSLGDIYVFERNLTNGQLTLQNIVDTNTGVDNIQIDDQDRLWIGAHANLFAFLSHARNLANRSPSEVIRLTPLANRPYEFSSEQIYLNDGNPLSGSSVADVSGQRLLIGSVFEPLFLDCQLAND